MNDPASHLTLSVLISPESKAQTTSGSVQRFLHISLILNNNNNNNNNNNSHDNVDGAVIMTEVIARVHPVHLMNVD